MKEYTKLLYLSLSVIHFDPSQPRKSFDEQKLNGLADSIKERGIKQPIVVKPHPGKENEYLIVIGERRARAAKIAGLKEVPCLLHEGDMDTFETSLLENDQREDLNPIDRAHAYKRLRDVKGRSHKEIAQLTGYSVDHIKATIKLLTLPKEIQEMVATNTLPQQTALNLKKIPASEAKLIRIAHDLIAGRIPDEILHQKLDEIPLPQNVSNARLPSTATLLLRGIVDQLYSLTTLAALLRKFIALQSDERTLSWEKLNTRAQDAIQTHLSDFVVVKGKFDEAMQLLDFENVKLCEVTERQRKRRMQALEVVTKILRFILYQQLSPRVNLSKAGIERFLSMSVERKQQDGARKSLVSALRVVSEYWYRSKEDSHPGSEDFLAFLAVVRKDYRTNSFNEFIDLLRKRDFSNDPLDISEAKDSGVVLEE